MGIILCARELAITKEQMALLYRNNLILCDDMSLNIGTVPRWAVKEAESLLGKTICGTEVTLCEPIRCKIDVSLHNRYHYPRLYKSICG